MKTIKLNHLLLLLMAFCVSSASAHDFEVNGIYYNINGNEATVTYRGTYYSQYVNEYTGFVVIPSTVTYNGTSYSVTSIGEYAFHYCIGLTNINIPNSVTTISDCAFYCTGLTSVTIPESVTSIGGAAFYGCSGLTSITIPNSVTTIGTYAFSNSGLTSITIPNSVTSIGASTFSGCSSLTSVTIPNSITSIGLSAFEGCSGLTSVNIPKSVTSIGSSAFYNCRGLNDVYSLIDDPSSISMGSDVFFRNPNNYTSRTLHVPVGAVSAYQADTNWSRYFGSIVGIKVFATSISLSETDATLYTDNTLQLTATVLPSTTTNPAVTWSSGNTSVATVSSNGLVTAKSVGNVVITATTADGSNLSASCNVAVKQLATSVSLNTTYKTLYMGNTLQLTAMVLPSTTTDKSVSWYSNNTVVATVSSDGLVTPISTGTATITVRTEDGSNLTAQCFVTVKQLATSISLSETDATMYTDNTLQLTATVLPSTTSNPAVTWSSSNTSVATVSSNGLVTAKSAGNAVITAKTADGSNLSASCNVAVKQLATSISLNKTSATLYMGNTLQLTATVLPNTTTDKSVSWSSNNTAVAIVSSDGLVTPKSTGTATITVRTEDGSNLTAQCVVTVKQLATSISLSESDAIMYTDNTLQLTATVLPSTTSNPSVSWSSSNTSVATVSSTGLVIAKSTGNAVITAKTSDGTNLSATCNITVKRLATSISLNKTSATLYLDQTVQLTATVSPSNATDRSVLWSSSDNSIANVSSSGLVTAIAPGNATITATTADGSDLSATCEITVNAYVTSLTLDQSEVTILEGDTITLTPTILPTYATNQTIYWSSNNTGVATVNNGVVVGRSGGETTITARTADGSNLYAYCQVKVIPNFDISMPNLSHLRGSVNNKYDLTVDLANRYDITGMQFDIQLPDGVTIAKDNNGEYDILLDDYRKTRNHTASASSIGYNTYRILVSSATANALKGHSGTVLHIMIEIPLYHVSGNKQVKYTNIILSEPDETRHTLSPRTSLISYCYKEGDANADVSVDVADYVITGNYILQNSPENFWYDAANVDHNNTIDVNDLTGITNIALGRREGGILQMPALQVPEDVVDIEMKANPLAIEAGQTKTLDLCLDGIHEFAGFQMDLQLPKGIRLVEASLVGENSGFSMATAELAEGSIRLLASSFSLKNLAVSKSAFLKLTLMAESSFNGNDIITLDNVKFSERNMDLHTLDNVVIPVGNNVSNLEHIYNGIRIYPEGKNIIIDSPESGTARIVTIAGITLDYDILPGHNVIPMEDSGFYIVTLNGTTAKLRLK